MSERSLAGLIGLFFWQYASIPLSRISADIWEESTSGAFEQTYLHATTPVLLILVRLTYYLLQQTLVSVPAFLALIVAFGFPMYLLWGLNWGLLFFCLLLTLLGLAGLGLAMGGILLIFRNAISYTSALEYLLLFVSGAVVPLSQLPHFLQSVAVWLPLTLGIQAMRQIEAGEDATLLLFWLGLQSLGLLLIGFLVFQGCLQRALRRGFAMSR
ncbi:ABC transporter permease [Meiothermus rufus]|uniref:ABC transporter permease n=1 Tax=Meiothermus rufus TaxID=604332 RepID=UPI0003F9F4DE|nr:ABC transporter permease [Meiothermus rufus]